MNVFISHAPEDKELAKRVADVLKASGFQVWDESQVWPGEIIAEHSAQALKAANAMIILLTLAAVNSTRVNNEISYALGKKEFKGRLVPVIAAPPEDLPEDEIPWTLKTMPMINLAQIGSEEGLKRIAHVLQQAA